ncbi:unnamed protein product [Orchesella dallaii]|uniref:Uncharacterized protein n=1 Tax=Orchesella dallaii TaxID=48710 RepID=A0ABP1RDP5_9HEXA
MKSASLYRFLWVSLLTFLTKPYHVSSVNSTDHLIDDEAHDPYKDMCKYHYGEYYRETSIKMVCCGNETLKLPAVLIHDPRENKDFAECSQKFSKDDDSDFPTAMWKAYICKLHKSAVFKSKDKISFNELFKFITQFYPPKVLQDIKTSSSKCAELDSQTLDDHIKIQKYMECYYEAENKTCHKPYAEILHPNDTAEEIQKTKELGCPVVPGLVYTSSIEYCCKKRSTPYPILEFPGIYLPEEVGMDVYNCQESFAQRERELKPDAFKSATPKTDDGEDHSIHTTWDKLCYSACMVNRKNYTLSMLSLDVDSTLDFYSHDFGKNVRSDISQIVNRRKQAEKIFLSMDVDTESSKPMTYVELSDKFSSASEIEKINYYCKFIDTISFEERRALHEHCFDEKYANEWGNDHHSFFVYSHDGSL